MANVKTPRWGWALTGSGHFFKECLAMIGELEEATELFERMLSLRNDVGLLAEEYDPRRRRQVGNFPQAFTHVGLVNAAYNLDRARRSRARALRSA